MLQIKVIKLHIIFSLGSNFFQLIRELIGIPSHLQRTLSKRIPGMQTKNFAERGRAHKTAANCSWLVVGIRWHYVGLVAVTFNLK